MITVGKDMMIHVSGAAWVLFCQVRCARTYTNMYCAKLTTGTICSICMKIKCILLFVTHRHLSEKTGQDC